MQHWGIETFFAISTTAAEHARQIADSLFVWPNFIDAELFRDYGESKLIPVLLTGATGPQYPWRRRIYKLISDYYPSLLCPHRGYLARSPAVQVMYGERYARTINASFVAPACGTIAKEVVRKHFEIPGCKACMITEKSPGLQAAGFVDMKNCVFADEHDVLDKVAYLFEHPEELQAITDAGYQLVHSRHTLKHRDQILQWFTLSKTLTATQRIVQASPFAPLAIVEASSGIGNSQIESNGLHLLLLHEGDEQLWAGKYEAAECLYLRCLNYMRRLPEARLRLALCNLYKGDAKRANEWVFGLIQYTLAEYKAVDPDPIEWAYYIISLLCLGKPEDARKCASEFPWLRHPELERTRWIINILRHKDEMAPLSHDRKGRLRHSIHQLPSRSNTEWLEQLCSMLRACRQCQVAERLTAHVSPQVLAAQQREDSSSMNRQILSTDDGDNYETWDKKPPLPFGKMHVLGSVNRRLLYYKLRRKVRNIVSRALRRAETTLGHMLPSSLWEVRNHEFVQAIHDLAREEDIRAALIIGATLSGGSTKALLAGALANKNRPSVFCISDSPPRFISLHRDLSNQAAVKWYRLSPSSLENPSAELEQTVHKIKEDNQLDFFDLVLIDGSELNHHVTMSHSASKELHAARFVLLDDINNVSNYENHNGLLRDPNFVLVDHNAGLRDGYAIFKKSSPAGGQVGNVLLSSSILTE
jgi:hypothetical protein